MKATCSIIKFMIHANYMVESNYAVSQLPNILLNILLEHINSSSIGVLDPIYIYWIKIIQTRLILFPFISIGNTKWLV